MRIGVIGRSLAVVFVTCSCSLLAQRGGPPRRLAHPETIQLEHGSRVEFHEFASSSIQGNEPYSIFLPPGYDQKKEVNFPLVYFLHGTNNDHTSWTVERYGNIPAALDELIFQGKLPPFILVCPDGDSSFYTDFLDGSRKYEQLVVTELVKEIRGHYRVKSGRRFQAIGGTSMGGYGALKISLKFPQDYASVVGSSPIILLGSDPSQELNEAPPRMAGYFSRLLAPIYGEPFDPQHWNRNSVLALARSNPVQGLNIYFAYGTADRYNRVFPMQKGIEMLDQVLTRRKIDHSYHTFPGEGHGWSLVRAHLEEMFRFLTQTFQEGSPKTGK